APESPPVPHGTCAGVHQQDDYDSRRDDDLAPGPSTPTTPDSGVTDSGDRFWEQVRVVSRLFRDSQGDDRNAARTGLGTRKTRREAHALQLADAPQNLHGKEGVDSSSPSEGSRKRRAN